MNTTIPEQLQQRHQLEMLLLQLEHQTRENEAALRQAKFDLREAQTAQTLYSGSFKSFRDKLTGKKEAAETALRHAVAKETTNLTAVQQEKTRLTLQTEEVHRRLEQLPTREELKTLAEGDTLRHWYRSDALYCMALLTPLLEVNRALLAERRNQFNGSYAGQVKTWHELADIYSAPEAAGEACKPYLLRLKAALDTLGIPFELHRCFEDPTAFLSSATQFTRMDRINTAIAQVESMQNLLPKLQKQLEG